MATGGLTPLRGRNTYMGWTKQAAWGTDLAPTNYWKWRKGSSASIKPKRQTAREGDTGRGINLSWTESQYGTFKVVEAMRPRTMGCGLQAFCGTGSDTFTAPTKSTTLAAQAGAGTNTFQSTADLGNVGANQPVNFSPGVPGLVYEVRGVNLASRTGTGPWTYTLVAGQTFVFTHPNSDPISFASTHVFTPQLQGYDPYAVEVGRGDGVNQPFQVVRHYDSVCADWQLTSENGGSPVLLEHTWYSAHEKLITGNAVPAYEGPGQVAAAGGPLTHAMAQGAWSLNGVTTGNFATLKRCVVKAKNTTSPEEWVTEAVQPSGFTLDDVDLTIEMSVKFQSFQDYYNTYFDGVSTASTLDSYIMMYVPFSVTWTGDGVNALTLSVPNAFLTAAEIPYDENNAPIEQSIMLTAQKGSSALFTFTLGNSQNSAY